jgi:NADH:ubiquinone reductase (H+-translocating)
MGASVRADHRRPSANRPGGRHSVVVVGGGFAGLAAVRRLSKADAEVTLVDRRNFHLFQPLLYQVASGALSPGEIAYPLRGILARQRNARVVLAEVSAIDLAGRRVQLCGQAGPGELGYDSLIVAAGAAHSFSVLRRGRCTHPA